MVSLVSLRITRKLVKVLRFAGAVAIILAGASASGFRASARNLLKQSKGSAPKIKDRPMVWSPPNLDKPVPSISATPPCVLSDVLNNAAARAQEFAANVPNFTATERIQYRDFANTFNLVDWQDGSFEYLALFALNGLTVKETRTPLKGTQVFPASSEGIGLPELALIFLPHYRPDFNMSCEGRVQWNGQPAWVVFFQQRPDKPNEMMAAGGANSPYRVKLKGRAWLGDSGDVLHLEIGAIGPIPIPLVENWWLSANYGPVQFHSQKIKMWLPQTADIYMTIGEGDPTTVIPDRQMIYHTFANFMVFSVHTYQRISQPH